MPDTSGGLQINQDMEFQRREWRAQRAGWFALCAFVLAALLGLFGGGPLSHARAGAPGAPLWVEYERFVRRGAAERVSIHLAAPSERRQALQVRVSRGYFDGLRIERVRPEPESMTVGPDDVVLRFTGEAAGTTTIVLDVEATAIGRQVATIAADGAPPAVLTQFVYF